MAEVLAIVDALGAERLVQGLALDQVAAAVPVSPKTLAHWESGVQLPAFPDAVPWAARLGWQFAFRTPRGLIGITHAAHAVELLMAERLRLGLARPAFGARVGLSKNSLAHWEQGGKPPRLPSFHQWVTAAEWELTLARPAAHRAAS